MWRALHASPPRNGELDTKKLVFGKLHKNVDNIKQKKNWKIFVLTNCEALKFWKQEWISNLSFSKISPMWRFVDATPLKQSVPSLKKRLRLFLQTVFWNRKAKKNRIRSLFPFEFSTKLEARTELMGIWVFATVLYGNLLGSALLFSPQNCQHKIIQNRVCNAFWWVFEWFSVIVITLEHAQKFNNTLALSPVPSAPIRDQDHVFCVS